MDLMGSEINTFDFEVNLFGPGYGESIAIRIGPESWMIVDSCEDTKGRPAALSYLESIGVPLDHVTFLVATHWHDDHVRGFSHLVEQCKNAKVCISNIFTKNEFVSFLSAYNKSHPSDKLTSGSSELLKVLKITRERGSSVVRAQPDRCLLRIDSTPPIEIWSLSPSDTCLERFMAYIAANMPKKGETKTRAPAIRANETAVALLIKAGEHAVLLGADLEETHKGWSAILASSGRPTERSSLFKVPHHGSETGHHPGVWDNMLVPNPIAILTPYNRSSKLPTSQDISRITSYSNKAFTTQILQRARKITRPAHVEKMIKETVVALEPINRNIGHIRASLPCGASDWEIELNNGASKL